MITLTQDYLVFGVKACHSAMLAFSRAPGVTDTNAWVLTIGSQSNTKSTLEKKGESSQRTYDSPDVLSCDSMRMFWIQFTNSEISFGKDQVLGQNRIGTMNTEDTDNYNSLALATDMGVSGQFTILTKSGK